MSNPVKHAPLPQKFVAQTAVDVNNPVDGLKNNFDEETLAEVIVPEEAVVNGTK
jgi:hypothetical protein